MYKSCHCEEPVFTKTTWNTTVAPLSAKTHLDISTNASYDHRALTDGMDLINLTIGVRILGKVIQRFWCHGLTSQRALPGYVMHVKLSIHVYNS